MAAASAELRLTAVFTDHAVLQRDKPVAVWGWADPGNAVTVRFGEHEAVSAARADDGRWQVELPAMPASSVPRELVVTATDPSGETTETRKVRDVLVGEVWLASGQSNMDWKVRNAAGKDELLATAGDYPHVRLLRTEHIGDFKARNDVGGRWAVSGDKDTEVFSAVAYAFARELHDDLGVPVGVLQSSVGGTRIETWTPPAALANDAALGPDRLWLGFAAREYATHERQRLDDVEVWTKRAREIADGSRGADLPDPPAWPTHAAAGWNRPGAFWHGMVAPLSPYTLRGCLWYQGESNKGEGELYRRRFEALIAGCRDAWGDDELPFLFVQLAPYRDTSGKYPRNALPWVWDAQNLVAEQPRNHMVVINDLGNVRDIHPRNKRGVAERLAEVALRHVYGHKDTGGISGPRFQSVSFDGDAAVVSFTGASALTTRDGEPPTHFALAGEDRVFHPANAAIDGGTLRVVSDAVPEPVAVRFAWDEGAEPNLVDADGHPVGAFRTDDWPEPFNTQQRVTLPLWPDGVPRPLDDVPEETTANERVRNVSRPTVELFFPRGFGDGVPRPAVLIFPGGAYGHLTIEKEGKAAARRLNEHGIIAGVVKYRASPFRAPVPALDGTQAIRLLEHHALDLGIDRARLGVLGFSAGGHVAASVSVRAHNHPRDLTSDVLFAPEDKGGIVRPDFTVLVYPVVSMADGVTHGGSRNNLIGPDPTAELIDRWSAELHVDADTPPAFLVHCADDGVSIANSERYAAALEAHGVPFVFERHDTGGHGFGLGDEEHPAAGWVDRAAAWVLVLPTEEHDAQDRAAFSP